MVGKRINARLLLATAGLLIVAGVAGALMSPGLEPDRKIKSRMGDVTWNHEQHARMEDIPNCQVCHHQEREGTTRPRPCSTCHNVEDELGLLIQADLFMEVEQPEYEGENGPPALNAFHGKCIGCHEAMEKGPVVCRDCHEPGGAGDHGLAPWNHYTHSRKLGIDSASGTAHSDCVSCHHRDQDAKLDGDYRPCSACHDPAVALNQPVATGMKGIDGVLEIAKHENAKHGECGKCHTETNPEDDPRTCKDCHTPWQYDVDLEQMPNLEEAIHQRCHECHNKSGEELNSRMPVTCNGCHQPDPSWLAGEEFGNILWSHKRHGMYREMDCETCHHQDLPGEPHMACRKCHGTGLYDNPPIDEALAERCVGCHEEKKTGLDQWPLLVTEKPTVEHFRIDAEEGSFWWNHHSHALGDSFSCQECHHNILRKDEVYVTSLRTGKPWPESATKIQSCRNCHGESGAVEGSAAEGSEAPPLLGAFEKACVTCHQRLGGGPQEWAEFFVKPEIVWKDVSPEFPEASEEGAS